MRTFEYIRATTVDQAVSALAQGGESARAMSGGTDIIVQMRAGRRVVDFLVDVKAVPETGVISYTPGDGLRIGASVPCYRIYGDDSVVQNYPGIIDSVSMIGGTAIQGRASLGGNLCNSTPSADGIPALLIMSAVCEIAGPNGRREVPVEAFCTGPGANVLEPGEMLVSLRIPAPQERFGAHYQRFIPRNEMDIAVAGAGASVVLDADKKSIVSARIALSAVAPTPLLVEEAAAALAGQEISDAAIDNAAAAAQAAARPIDDMRGTAEYRKHLVGVLTKRAVRTAIERAQ